MGKRVNKVGSAFLRQLLKQMKRMGLNRTTFAARLNLARPYVTKVLNGDVNITLDTAVRFATALGMDMKIELFPKEEDAPVSNIQTFPDSNIAPLPLPVEGGMPQ